MATVLDYSGWRPSAAQMQQMKQLGVIGVSRYLAQRSTGAWKRITKPEYDLLLSQGLAVVLNFEETAGRGLEGYNAGFEDGRYARGYARSLGHPDERPIIQSIDVGVTSSTLSGVLEYQRGFNDGGGCGPQAMYGGTFSIDPAWRAGLIRFGWQANASSWSPRPSDAVAIKQRLDKPLPFSANLYDINDVIKPDWGQHPAPGGGGLTPENTCLFGYRCPLHP